MPLGCGVHILDATGCYLDETVGVPVDRDAMPTRRDGVVELVEEEAGEGQLGGDPVGDEHAAHTTRQRQ
jgi:hypothetical protein